MSNFEILLAFIALQAIAALLWGFRELDRQSPLVGVEQATQTPRAVCSPDQGTP